MKIPNKSKVTRQDIQLEKVGRMEILPRGDNCGFTCVLQDIIQLELVKEMGITKFRVKTIDQEEDPEVLFL